MKVVLSACVLAVATLAAAAPLESGAPPAPQGDEGHQLLREKRSSYGSPYTSPCAAAPLPPSAYQLNLAPVHHGGYAPHAAYAPQGYGYGLPHYRSDMMEDQDMMSFSDMDPFMSEHAPMARYAYAPVPAAHYGGAGLAGLSGLGAQLAASAGTGPAFGVFPNANTGGCSVPLLLSCSPSIVPGRIVRTHPHTAFAYGGAAVVPAAPDAYRGVDEQTHREGHEHEEPPQVHDVSPHDAGHVSNGHQ